MGLPRTTDPGTTGRQTGRSQAGAALRPPPTIFSQELRSTGMTDGATLVHHHPEVKRYRGGGDGGGGSGQSPWGEDTPSKPVAGSVHDWTRERGKGQGRDEGLVLPAPHGGGDDRTPGIASVDALEGSILVASRPLPRGYPLCVTIVESIPCPRFDKSLLPHSFARPRLPPRALRPGRMRGI